MLHSQTTNKMFRNIQKLSFYPSEFSCSSKTTTKSIHKKRETELQIILFYPQNTPKMIFFFKMYASYWTYIHSSLLAMEWTNCALALALAWKHCTLLPSFLPDHAMQSAHLCCVVPVGQTNQLTNHVTCIGNYFILDTQEKTIRYFYYWLTCRHTCKSIWNDAVYYIMLLSVLFFGSVEAYLALAVKKFTQFHNKI